MIYDISKKKNKFKYFILYYRVNVERTLVLGTLKKFIAYLHIEGYESLQLKTEIG